MPEFGVTLWSVLRALDVPPLLLWVIAVLLALPCLLLTLFAAARRQTRLYEVLCLGLMAAFFIVPYARAYDLCVLLLPALVLLDRRLTATLGSILLIVLLVCPYAMVLAFPHHVLTQSVFFFGIPALLLAAWLRTREQPATPSQAALAELKLG
jgi:hypothetical protein